MDFIALVIVVSLIALCWVGGLALFWINLRGVNAMVQSQPEREAAFLEAEMAASYDAAKHMREEG
jgi:uncharacterized membrane protein